MSGLLVFFLLQAVVFGGFCSWLAKEKDRDRVGWFMLGALFSLIALIAIAAVPKSEEPSKREHVRVELPWEREKRETDSTRRMAMVVGGIVLVVVLFFVIGVLLKG